VRDEWERIKLSYEILIDKQMRFRYDRNIAMVDPASALTRAALSTAGRGLTSVGKGVFQFGAFALEHFVRKDDSKQIRKDDSKHVNSDEAAP